MRLSEGGGEKGGKKSEEENGHEFSELLPVRLGERGGSKERERGVFTCMAYGLAGVTGHEITFDVSLRLSSRYLKK
jgi:hypothetical protein